MCKQISVGAQLKMANSGKKSELTGRSPLRRQISTLDCCAIEEEEKQEENDEEGEEAAAAA